MVTRLGDLNGTNETGPSSASLFRIDLNAIRATRSSRSRVSGKLYLVLVSLLFLRYGLEYICTRDNQAKQVCFCLNFIVFQKVQKTIGSKILRPTSKKKKGKNIENKRQKCQKFNLQYKR